MQLIDKDALLKDLGMASDCSYCDKNRDEIYCDIRISDPVEVCIAINHAPTIEERKTGKWIFIGNQMFECSECGTCYTQSQFHQMRVRISDPEFPKFCPNCGDAK